MTEEEWLTSNDIVAMTVCRKLKKPERKRRLFACACCRRIWTTLKHPAGRHAVEIAELFADGKATKKELKDAARAASRATEDSDEPDIWKKYRSERARIVAKQAASDSRNVRYAAVNSAELTPHPKTERIQQSHLLRDIFGNPFRPVAVDPAWLTSTAVGLARGIYDDRAFDRLPILADALQDAGCENADILGHCRSDGPHVRGCWVVDLVLGNT